MLEPRLPDERPVLGVAQIEAPIPPMAFADAFGAALAVAERAELWTGDPAPPRRRLVVELARSTHVERGNVSAGSLH